jgi:predicted MFS family arabinose efflux permease
VAFFMLLARYERRANTPLFPTSLLKSPGFFAVNAITLFLYMATSAVFYFLPLNLIQVHHYAASEAGAALAPMILTLFILSYWGGGLLARFGARRSLTVGSSIVSVAFLGMCLPGSGGSYWSTYFIPMVVFGLGMSVCVAPLTTTVMNSAPEHLTGAASGINNAISRAAGLLAVAVFGLVLSISFNHELDSSLQTLKLSRGEQTEVERQRPLLAAARFANPALQRASDASFVASFRLVIFLSAGLALVSAICAWSMLAADPSNKR